MVRAAREEARWAVARQITGEIAAEFGVTDTNREWAASVLGLDAIRRQYVLDAGELVAHDRRDRRVARTST